MPKQYKMGVRVISRYNQSDPEAGLFNAAQVQEYQDQMVKDGWRLMGQPQFTGMEGYMEQLDAGFRVMYWWERGD